MSPQLEVQLGQQGTMDGTPLAIAQQVAASTQNQALSALLLLSRDVLNTPLDHSLDAARAKKPKRLPTVLTKDETLKGIEHLSATP